MKEVVMIAYEFPPLTTGGAFRPFKFAKALPDEGFEPIVITAGGENEGHEMLPYQHTVENGTQVYRCSAKAPKSRHAWMRSAYFSSSDDIAKRWKASVMAAMRHIVRAHSPAVLWVTAPPFSMLRLGVDLSKAFKLPLVLDLRDPWSQWVIAPYPSYLHYKRVVQLERKALLHAEQVVCTSVPMKQLLERSHPAVKPEKIKVITNGYDISAHRSTGAINLGPIQADQTLTIGYLGSFYYDPYRHHLIFSKWFRKKPHQIAHYTPRIENWKYRSPYFFLLGLQLFKETHPEWFKRLKVCFAGAVPSWLPEMIAEFGLAESIELLGPLPHSEAIDFQQSCDLMLITSARVEADRDVFIAGKTFEHLAFRKPMLALVSEGAQRDLVEQSGLGVFADPDDPASLVTDLHEILSTGIILRPNEPFISSLDIRVLTHQLALIFQRLQP